MHVGFSGARTTWIPSWATATASVMGLFNSFSKNLRGPLQATAAFREPPFQLEHDRGALDVAEDDPRVEAKRRDLVAKASDGRQDLTDGLFQIPALQLDEVYAVARGESHQEIATFAFGDQLAIHTISKNLNSARILRAVHPAMFLEDHPGPRRR